MRSKSGIGDRMHASLERGIITERKFLVESIWDVEQWRRVQVGASFKDRLVARSLSRNVCTDEGLNALLDIMFHGSTQVATWYVAIFESNTSCVVGMTYATPVYTECTAYDEATRPEYVEAAASGKSLTNSANKAVFTINATKTIYGGALVGGGSTPTTKGDAAGGGKLFCASQFSASKSCVDDDVLRVTVTLTAADV